ncbi:hypothetical protein MTO96_051106 [Rhipicephalus appendiculatus]
MELGFIVGSCLCAAVLYALSKRITYNLDIELQVLRVQLSIGFLTGVNRHSHNTGNAVREASLQPGTVSSVEHSRNDTDAGHAGLEAGPQLEVVTAVESPRVNNENPCISCAA